MRSDDYQSRPRKLKLTQFVPSEYDAQIAVFAWARMNEHNYPELRWMHSTLNGIRLPIGLAKKAKMAGNKQGPPDIYLDVPRQTSGGLVYHGLRIELKRLKGGVVSEEQEDWHLWLQQNNFYIAVCAGYKQAIEAIVWYLSLEKV